MFLGFSINETYIRYLYKFYIDTYVFFLYNGMRMHLIIEATYSIFLQKYSLIREKK